MIRRCCDGTCNQGRTCPVRTVRIPTRRGPLSRAAGAIGEVCNTHPWLPPVIALAVLFVINS